MKKKFAGLVLVVGALCGVATAGQADAAVEAPTVQTAPVSVQHGPDPLPTTIFTSYKFWPYANAYLCVALGATPSEIPIGVAAQAWNNASVGVALDAEANCVTAGYTQSTRMTIDTYSAADGVCYKLTNTDYAAADTFRRWTGANGNIIGWVNLYYEGCRADKAKWTSIAIGRSLGMATLIGSQWDGRVMSRTSAVQYASASTDGPSLTLLYKPQYFGWW